MTIAQVAVPEIRLDSVVGMTLSDFASQHGLDRARFAYLICGNRSRAEDRIQDVFLAMHRRFGELARCGMPIRPTVAVAGWLPKEAIYARRAAEITAWVGGQPGHQFYRQWQVNTPPRVA